MPANMMDVQNTFDRWFGPLGDVCQIKAPWAFLCMAALIEYLAKLAYCSAPGPSRPFGPIYEQFVKNYFPPAYIAFTYTGGQQDLPTQMYHVLRCGIVHSFSLIPDPTAIKHSGRDRSIVLIHSEEAQKEGQSHLDNYSDKIARDAALFVAEDFLSDINSAANSLVAKATPGSPLEGNILAWYQAYPPIVGRP